MRESGYGDAEVVLSGGWSCVIGRNGTFTPKVVRIWQGVESAHIDVLGKRGLPIKAGIELPLDDMDRLAMRWLEARGIMMPAR